MLSIKIEKSLNDQIALEAEASMKYLAMASWSEINGYNGIANFFYNQSDEEKNHMIKLLRFVNERGGKAIIPDLKAPESEYEDIQHLFSTFLESEKIVSKNIAEIIFQTLDQKSYTVHNFLQWYVSEQAEEEALARTIMDKLKIIGNDKSGIYLLDRDIASIRIEDEVN